MWFVGRAPEVLEELARYRGSPARRRAPHSRTGRHDEQAGPDLMSADGQMGQHIVDPVPGIAVQ